MQGAGERGPAEPRLTASRGQDGHVETVLQRGMLGHAELGQQAAVSRAATEEDVLAGVDDQAVPVKGTGRTAEPGPGLEQRDVRARLRERDRGGDPGQPAADHSDSVRSPPGPHPPPRSPFTALWLAHLILPARAFTATAAFSP